MDVDDFCLDGESDSSCGTPTHLMDFSLFSRTDTLEDSASSSPSHTNTHSPDTDRSGRSLSDSDIEVGVLDDKQQVKG